MAYALTPYLMFQGAGIAWVSDRFGVSWQLNLA
jgi:uncharacterized glyoxalase superfamily protein PhnB